MSLTVLSLFLLTVLFVPNSTHALGIESNYSELVTVVQNDYPTKSYTRWFHYTRWADIPEKRVYGYQEGSHYYWSGTLYRYKIVNVYSNNVLVGYDVKFKGTLTRFPIEIVMGFELEQ